MGTVTITWTTADGKKLKLSEMSDSHLRNAINYLKRQADDEQHAYWSIGSMLQGEMAQDFWNSQMNQEEEKYHSRMAIMQLMEKELTRRAKWLPKV